MVRMVETTCFLQAQSSPNHSARQRRGKVHGPLGRVRAEATLQGLGVGALQSHAEPAGPTHDQSACNARGVLAEPLRLCPRQAAQLQKGWVPKPPVGLDGERHHSPGCPAVRVPRPLRSLRLQVGGAVGGSNASQRSESPGTAWWTVTST